MRKTESTVTGERYAGYPPRWAGAYADGVPLDIEIPEESLSAMLDRSAHRFSRRTALHFMGAELTYAELHQQVMRTAEALRRQGVRPADRVALVLPNCPQHVVAFYAVLRLGAVVVEHNPLYTAEELEHQFADHGAELAIVWDKVTPSIASFRSRVPLKTVLAVSLPTALPRLKQLALRLPLKSAKKTLEAMSGPAIDAIGFEDLVASCPPLPSSVPGPTPDDVAALQYTGGTTGIPKGAVLTHRNLRANAAQGRAWTPTLKEGREVFYGVLPFFHAYGLTLCLTYAVSIGATVVLFPKFDPALVLDAMKKTPCTFLPAVPPIYERVAKDARHKGVSLRSIRVGLSGAVSLPPDIVELWEQETGGLLVEGYGMTEASPVALGNPVSKGRRPGAIGVPFPNTDLRIVDPEHPDQDRELGSAGELLLKGPQVMQGYWNRPQDTAETLLSGGWLRTGDIGIQDEDGYITIVDRIKELIITGGFNVYPSEVEDVLRAHTDIADASVVGLPHSHSGEEVVAAVIAEPGRTVDPDAIRAYCRAHLAAYKVPRRVVVVDDLPRSLIGKILRREVRQQLLKGSPH